MKMPLFSNFISHQKKRRKEAILGSKRLSLDSINKLKEEGSPPGTNEGHKKIKILIPDRRAKQSDVEVIILSSSVRAKDYIDQHAGKEYEDGSLRGSAKRRYPGALLSRL